MTPTTHHRLTPLARLQSWTKAIERARAAEATAHAAQLHALVDAHDAGATMQEMAEIIGFSPAAVELILSVQLEKRGRTYLRNSDDRKRMAAVEEQS